MTLLAVAAVAGAALAIGLREWVEWRYRVAKRRADCHHDFFETSFEGYITKHCRICGHQEVVREQR